jgi:hypothetical protein
MHLVWFVNEHLLTGGEFLRVIMNVADESRQLNFTTGKAHKLAHIQRKSRDNSTPKDGCNEAGRNITKLLHPICLFLEKKKLCHVHF